LKAGNQDEEFNQVRDAISHSANTRIMLKEAGFAAHAITVERINRELRRYYAKLEPQRRDDPGLSPDPPHR
jgi:hypothetical protein